MKCWLVQPNQNKINKNINVLIKYSYANNYIILYPINFYYVTILLLLLGFFAIFYIAPLLSLIPTATKLGKTNPGLTFGLTNTSCNFIAFFPPLVMGIIIQTYQDIMLSLMSLILFTLINIFRGGKLTYECGF